MSGTVQPRSKPVESSAMLCEARSRMPMKRTIFEDDREDYQLIGHPSPKRFFTEELVAAHLEHLKLSPSSSSSSLPTGHTYGTEELVTAHLEHLKLSPSSSFPTGYAHGDRNPMTISSCSHSTGCQSSRKRCLQEFEACGGLDSLSEQYCKRMRLDEGASNRRMKLNTCQHSGSAMLTSAHAVGSMSSIPEEAEPIPCGRLSSPQTTPSDKMGAGGCDVPPILPPPPSPLMIQTDHKDLPFLSPDFLSSSSLGSSVPPLSPPSPPVAIGDACSVWVAPEIQMIKTASPLPNSVVQEINSTGMELVPWVSMDALLQGHGRQEEKAESKEQTPEPEDNSQSTLQTIHHYKDSEMDMLED